MTYEQYINNRQAEFNALPIFFAFGQKQLDDALAARKATIEDIVSIGQGGFVLKKDLKKVHYWLDKPNEIPELMKDRDFAIGAFYYEMRNHEYQINHYQGNWDVLNCFAEKELKYRDDDDWHEYLKEMGHPEWETTYKFARTKYLNDCNRNNWY